MFLAQKAVNQVGIFKAGLKYKNQNGVYLSNDLDSKQTGIVRTNW